MKKRLNTTFLFLVALAMLVAGCSTGKDTGPASNSPSPTGTSSKGEPVQLTWWLQDGRNDVNEILEGIKADFEKANPNVKINVVKTPDKDMAERMSIAVNTKQLPDIQQGAFQWPLGYAYKNLVVPIDDIIDKADFEPSLLDNVTVNGKAYIYPNGAVPIGLLVNVDLFEAKNALDLLPKNMEPWSIEQFVKAVKAVTDPAKQTYGFNLFAGDTGGDQANHVMMWAFGAKSFEGKKAVLNSPQGVEGLQFMVSLIDQGLVPPGAAGLKATDTRNALYNTGKLGMTYGNLGNVLAVETAFKSGLKPFKQDLIPFPTKDGKSTNTVVFGYGTWVWNTNDAKKIEMSKKFVQFINSKENMAKLTQATASLITRKSLMSSYPEGSFLSKSFKLMQNSGDVGAKLSVYQETRNAFYPEMQAAFTKKKTPKQALDDWTQKVNKMIEDADK